MLKIETDYNAEAAACLLNILTDGINVTCLFCSRFKGKDCPANDVEKVIARISEFIDICKEKEGHE